MIGRYGGRQGVSIGAGCERVYKKRLKFKIYISRLELLNMKLDTF